ncbi:MAG: hypothetical protein PHC64_11270 [Candidatus Gastranaerophilales bacterium]|nr:hypothetical protein [Candidatus Gastranaerophilales bacterium]
MSEDKVLKGYISNIRYIWHANGDKPCELCEDLDGTEFESADEIPDKPHPNCNCYIEEVEIEDNEDGDGEGEGGDEPCDCYETVSGWLEECEEACCEYDDSSDEGDNALEELQSIESQIQSYATEKIAELQELQDEINQLKDDAIEELQDAIEQTVKTIQIFWDNFSELRRLKEELHHYLDLSAEYYHTKANCEAAQLGDVGAQVAEILGYLREFTDFPKEIIFKGCSIKEAFEHSVHDLEVNEAGRKLGKEHPNEDPEVIIKKPDGMPPGF